MSDSRSRKSNCILRTVFALLIFAVGIRHIGEIYQPTLLDDEFSYWSIAAYFNGRDWSDITSLCKYYSYGYSIILAVIMKIFTDTIIMYRAAVVLNGILLVVGYLLLENIFVKIFPEEDRKLLISVSFIMTLIPCNVAFSTVNLTECLLYALFLAIVRLGMDMGGNMSIWKWILMSALMGYSYMVHQRMMSVIIAVILAAAVMLFRKKIKLRDMLIMAVVLGAAFLTHHFVKSDIKANLWLDGVYSADNDYGSIWENLCYVTSSLKNIAVFIIGIAGKLFYYGTATYIFGFAGVAILGVKSFREIFRNENTGTVFTISLVSFVIMIFISALFMCHMEKMAWLLYGRYAEMMYPLLFGLAVIYIYRMIKASPEKAAALMAGSALLYIFMGILIKWYAAHRGLNWINYISCSQIYKYASGDHLPVLKMMFVVVVTMIMFFAVMSIRKYSGVALAFLGIFAFILFIRTGEIPIESINLKLQSERYETADIAGFIKASDKEVYYYVNEEEDDDTAQYREYIQYWLFDETLHYVKDENIKTLDSGSLVIVSYTGEYSPVNDSWQEVYRNEVCRVYIV